MRILHVISTMDPVSGGTGQGIRNSNDELERLGIKAEVVCLDNPGSAYLKTENVTIHALGRGKGPWQYNANLKPWLDRNLDRFDAVVINGLWLSSGYIAWKCIRRFRERKGRNGKAVKDIKFFVMPHGMLDPYFQKAPERKLKAIRNNLYWKLIEHKVVNNADGLLFTCETELLLAREAFQPYQPERELNVGYGVTAPPPVTPAMLKAFQQSCPEIGSQPYLLFLSRIHEKKGVDLLIKAYIHLQEKLGKEGISMPKLVIAGPGLETPYGQKIYKMAIQASGTHHSIYFPGMLSGNTKWGAFYGAEAFILPSHQENFGFAVVESLACSKPVLISDQVNIWREIEAAGGGIVAADTAEGTEKILERWVRLVPEEKQKMNSRAFQTYEQHFNIKQAAGSFAQAISLAAGIV